MMKKLNIFLASLILIIGITGCASFQESKYVEPIMPAMPKMNNPQELIKKEPQLADWLIQYKLTYERFKHT